MSSSRDVCGTNNVDSGRGARWKVNLGAISYQHLANPISLRQEPHIAIPSPEDLQRAPRVHAPSIPDRDVRAARSLRCRFLRFGDF
jgi:hypothetical protein